MPLLAVVGAGAALTIGGGAAAIGAVVAGTATLATTLTAVAAVGATLGAVGAVTHDKTLSTVGMVMGGIGGVGALAANAGLLGASATTDSLFGSASGAADGLAPVTVTPQAWGADAGLTAAGEGALQGAAAANENDIISSLGSMKIDAALPNVDFGDGLSSAVSGNAALPPATTGGDTTATGLINGGKAASGTTTGASSSATPSTDPLSSATKNATTTSNVISPGMGPAPPGATAGTQIKGLDGNTYTFDGKTWTQDQGFFNKLVSSPMGQLGMLQAGGSLISGMFDPLKPAQVNAYNAQADANRAGAALTAAQTANMQQPIPVATRVKQAVTGAPAGTGIINQAPSPALPITGAIA